MNFADKVKKMVDSAPAALAGGTNVNYGPLTVTPMIVAWKGKGNKPDKFTIPEYMKANDLKDEEEIKLEDGKESFQLSFDIDITVLSPARDFHVQRDIEVKESNRSNKDPKKHVLTSWSEIVKPSLEKTFGKDWYSKLLPNGKKAAPVVWVAAEQVDPVEPVKEGKKSYSVPKFIAVYEDEDACRAARDLRYPPRDEAAEMAFGEEEAEAEDSGEGFDEETLDSVRELFNANRKNKKQTLSMLKGNPFGEYDAEELFAAALPNVK